LEERKEVGAGGFQVTPQAPPGSGGASRIQMLADLAVLGGNAERKVSFDIGLVCESEATVARSPRMIVVKRSLHAASTRMR